MGRLEHHRYCGQLWLGEDFSGNGGCEVAESTLGGDSRNGIYYDPSEQGSIAGRQKSKEDMRTWR